MAISVNELIQTACEDLSRVGDGEPISPELAASCEELLNRAINSLNSDSYISLTVNTKELVAAGSVRFFELEEGEELPPNCVNMAPPDTIQGVARQVGIRWLKLTPSNPQTMDRVLTYSLPTQWSYGVTFEEVPNASDHGNITRRVGVLSLNGTHPVPLKIYLNSSLPHYRLGDFIYLSDLYHDLLLYSLEMRMVAKYKLYSYKDQVKEDLAGAMRSVDNFAAANRPMRNDDQLCDSYTRPADDLIAGFGM